MESTIEFIPAKQTWFLLDPKHTNLERFFADVNIFIFS